MYFDRLKPGQRKLNSESENRLRTAVEGLIASAGADAIVSPDGGIAFRRRLPASALPILHITSAATGSGIYICREVVESTTPIDAAAALTSTVLGTDGDDDVVLINLQEIDQSPATHWLTHADNTKQTYLVPDKRSRLSDSAGRTVYVVNALWLKACS